MQIKKKCIREYLIMIFVYFIYSFVNLFAKYASQYKFLSKNYIKFYSMEIFILMIYAIVWQQIIKNVDISIAYVWRGSVIVWTTLWSILFFNEHITLNNVIGAIIIILGILVVVKSE